MAPAQSFVTSYPPRVRQYANTLLQPVLQTQNVGPGSRTTKRGTTIINYADDAYDDDDFDDSETSRRPTGLRSLRREDLEKREPQHEKLGKEIYQPVSLQPIYRDWIVRRTVRPTYVKEMPQPRPSPIKRKKDNVVNPDPMNNRTDSQANIQAQLPLTLIPIRIDLDVPQHQPEAPYPFPPRGMDMGLNPALPLFKRPELAPGYKIRDIFLWNLHEELLTPDDFALNFVRELDLPNQTALAMNISQQIRNQLEDYAGVAMHPLFHTQAKKAQMPEVNNAGTPSAMVNGSSRDGTPRPLRGASISRPASTTPATPAPSTPRPATLTNGAAVTAIASPLPADPLIVPDDPTEDPHMNPDDSFRCIITLSIYLSSRLYQDKFEWSLLHPPGAAEAFAKQTCADMGLNGEWVMAITHAIYEAVLRLKKEACEGGMIMIGGGAWGGGEMDNQAIRAEEGAGWRYDIDDFGAEWEPKFEALSKEEIEKREGDRERQLRRLRRETARFSSTAGMVPSAREQEAQLRGSYFDYTAVGTGGEETPSLGRGERSKKKRRFRSLSPVGKAQTPESSASAAWGGEGNRLQEYERQTWRCKHCLIWGNAVWAVRDGPLGARTLCNNCGLIFERDKKLPVWADGLHKHDVPLGR
ncbi:Chromatin structure remodeling complex protein sfh1 [Exophiala xenobiotica]|nr:Chromatin structure remodeling complex protein sfh1 [Exophiala xenobiotica]KAK5249271.1 Chromatin structure remodeling complex protein sfh1 [Exophiala xenobiotica]KAK5271506.1 Chromatin structure remodeling complex protein sfh1 [Exophiala xenobiotica]KAK5326466.1 Chromatin structure remodeling complex protein sfh1 [Exophiala xenobiotica]KAK5342743.1 Chromatin structure remodeling complex protein sfh1 [Exophiala xenobiotica]